jgi:hypothetical protein
MQRQNIELDIRDLQMLLGEKDIVIMQLQREILRLQEELKDKSNPKFPTEFAEPAYKS